MALLPFVAVDAASQPRERYSHLEDLQTLLAANIEDLARSAGPLFIQSAQQTQSMPKSEPSEPRRHRESFPSWCDNAKTKVERSICSDLTLADLDARLNESYLRARHGLSPDQAAELQQSQRAWLKKRNRCERQLVTTPCLVRAYEARLAELNQVVAKPVDVSQSLASQREVREIQQILTESGYNPGPVDGVAGTKTRDAIQDFQAANGITVNGIPTSELLTTLRSLGSPSATAGPSQSTSGSFAGSKRQTCGPFHSKLAMAGAIMDPEHHFFVVMDDGGLLNVSQEGASRVPWISKANAIFPPRRVPRTQELQRFILVKTDGTASFIQPDHQGGLPEEEVIVQRLSALKQHPLRKIAKAHEWSRSRALALRADCTLWELRQDSLANLDARLLDRWTSIVDIDPPYIYGVGGEIWDFGERPAHSPLTSPEIRRVFELDSKRLALMRNGNVKDITGESLRFGGVFLEGPADIVQLAYGGTHVLALTRQGVVWAWGSNRAGELGDGTDIDRELPVRLQNLPPIIEVAASDRRSAALARDGSLWAWGLNKSLGIGGSAKAVAVPTQVKMRDGGVVSLGAFETTRDASLDDLTIFDDPFGLGLGNPFNSACYDIPPKERRRNGDTFNLTPPSPHPAFDEYEVGTSKGLITRISARSGSSCIPEGNKIFLKLSAALLQRYGEPQLLEPGYIDIAIEPSRKITLSCNSSHGLRISFSLANSPGTSQTYVSSGSLWDCPGQYVPKDVSNEPFDRTDPCSRERQLVQQGGRRNLPLDPKNLRYCIHKLPLAGADLSGAELYQLTLKKADLNGIDFSGANLTQAFFYRTDLSRAKFRDANLTNAVFEDCNLTNADFTNADLTGADLSKSNLQATIFAGARMDGLELPAGRGSDETEVEPAEETTYSQPVQPHAATGFQVSAARNVALTDGSSVAEEMRAHLAGKRVSFHSPATANGPPMNLSTFVCSNGEFLFRDNAAAALGSIGGSVMRTGRWSISGRGGQARIFLRFSNGEQMTYEAVVRAGITYIEGTRVAVSDDNVLCE
jgi:uncharacterized protein YjbI with pentapeptide repeats/uncharacterized protein